MSEIVDALRQLTIGEHDIIVLKGLSRLQAEDFVRTCQTTGWKYPTPVLFIHGDQQVETLSRDRMRSIGYIHESEMRNLVKAYWSYDDDQVQNPHGDEF